MKEFVCVSTTDIFVPVSQLSTRDLFYFLNNLKIKQDIFVLNFSSCSIVRTTSVMIPLFQIFGTKVFKKMLILECLGVILQSQLWCPSWIFDTSLSERCLKYWLVKKIITGHDWLIVEYMDRLEPVGFSKPTSWAPCRECKPKKGINLSEKSLSLS